MVNQDRLDDVACPDCDSIVELAPCHCCGTVLMLYVYHDATCPWITSKVRDA